LKNKVIYIACIAAWLVSFLSCSHTAKPTYNDTVAAILYKNCTVCHRPGGNAHFSIASYAEAKKYAAAIAYVTRERLMPPWPADPHYTQFKGQRVLTENEINILQQWAADSAPEGAGAPPPLPTYHYGEMTRKPDLHLPVPPVLLPAYNVDKFLLVKVPFEIPHDTFASVIEFVPGRHNVVHHVNGDMVLYPPGKKQNVFAGASYVSMENDTAGLLKAFEKLSIPNDDGTYPVLQKSVVNYLPGVYMQPYPNNIGGYVLPQKGAFLLNDLHYGFTTRDSVIDSSFIDVYYMKAPPKRPVKEFQLGTIGLSPVEPDMVILPNTTKQVSSRFKVPYDISILTINPHMHLLGKSFKAYALQPNGDTIRLIWIPRWDFNWQYFYTFKKMVKIPAGSTIVAEGVYDNTRQNLNNPFSPPQVVTDQNGSMKATDEMFQFIVTYLPYEKGDEDISLENE
jgi:Copper type II ascorbate-dependent monooxygenase, C-terminal domain